MTNNCNLLRMRWAGLFWLRPFFLWKPGTRIGWARPGCIDLFLLPGDLSSLAKDLRLCPEWRGSFGETQVLRLRLAQKRAKLRSRRQCFRASC